MPCRHGLTPAAPWREREHTPCLPTGTCTEAATSPCCCRSRATAWRRTWLLKGPPGPRNGRPDRWQSSLEGKHPGLQLQAKPRAWRGRRLQGDALKTAPKTWQPHLSCDLEELHRGSCCGVGRCLTPPPALLRTILQTRGESLGLVLCAWNGREGNGRDDPPPASLARRPSPTGGLGKSIRHPLPSFEANLEVSVVTRGCLRNSRPQAGAGRRREGRPSSPEAGWTSHGAKGPASRSGLGWGVPGRSVL